MYCDKPLRIFLTVYVLRLVISSPLSIYLHLAPRRQRRRPRQDERAELGENFAMTELLTLSAQPLPQQQPTLPIPIPTATHVSSDSINPITRPPPPIPPMVYPPPPPPTFSQSTLINWIVRYCLPRNTTLVLNNLMFHFLDQNLRWIYLLLYGSSLGTICCSHQQLAQRRRNRYTIFPWWLSYMDI
jgi:hypothetical protein